MMVFREYSLPLEPGTLNAKPCMGHCSVEEHKQIFVRMQTHDSRRNHENKRKCVEAILSA